MKQCKSLKHSCKYCKSCDSLFDLDGKVNSELKTYNYVSHFIQQSTSLVAHMTCRIASWKGNSEVHSQNVTGEVGPTPFA